MRDGRHLRQRAVMELASLLGELRVLVREGGRRRYFDDARYRWVIHRLWIAIGNETQYWGPRWRDLEPWHGLRKLRNELAHMRLPDIEDDKVWRISVLRPADLVRQLDIVGQ